MSKIFTSFYFKFNIIYFKSNARAGIVKLLRPGLFLTMKECLNSKSKSRRPSILLKTLNGSMMRYGCYLFFALIIVKEDSLCT